MELNGAVSVFFAGVAGALLVELVKLIGWRDRDVISAHYGSGKYWVATLALFIVSGAVAVWKCDTKPTLEQAVQLGIDAPALIGGLATASTTRKRNKSPKRFMDAPAGAVPQNPSVGELLSW